MAADEYVGRARIADLLGVDERSIATWTKEHADFPSRVVGRSRTYPVRACVQWLIAHRAKSLVGIDEAKERARKLRAEADKAELIAAQMRGELAPKADMVQAVERIATAVRNEVAGLRSRFVLRVIGIQTPHEAAQVLDDMALQILGGLTATAETLADAADDVTPDDEVAA